jgi:hypothetical protein
MVMLYLSALLGASTALTSLVSVVSDAQRRRGLARRNAEVGIEMGFSGSHWTRTVVRIAADDMMGK